MYRTAVDVGQLNRPNSYELRNLRRRLPEPRHRRPCLHGRLRESLEDAIYGTRDQEDGQLPFARPSLGSHLNRLASPDTTRVRLARRRSSEHTSPNPADPRQDRASDRRLRAIPVMILLSDLVSTVGGWVTVTFGRSRFVV
jgi:hypothetical protein